MASVYYGGTHATSPSASTAASNKRTYDLMDQRDAAVAEARKTEDYSQANYYNRLYDEARGMSKDYLTETYGYNAGASQATYGGGSYGAGGYSGGGVSSLQAQLEAARLAQEEAAAERKAAYESALRSTYNTSLGELGQGAASANTGEYVRYMQNKNGLPQQAALLGTGGLSESSLMGLSAAYGGNLNAIELERARGQASLENQLAQGIAQGEGQYADTMAGIGNDYANKLLSLSMQEEANRIARNQALQAQSNWEKEFTANQAQLGVANALNQSQFDLTAQKYANSQAKSTGTTSSASTYSAPKTTSVYSGDINYGNAASVTPTSIYRPVGPPKDTENLADYYRALGYSNAQIAGLLNAR